MSSFFARPPTARAANVATLLLLAVVFELYALYLGNPLVFDDFNFFDGADRSRILEPFFSFDLRWLPNATLEWTRKWFVPDLPVQRAINLAFHLASTLLLAALLRRLLALALPPREAGDDTLAPYWIASFGAAIFALHPAAVYAVGYLIQRSSLMALFFTLLSWRWLLAGAVDGRRGRLPLSAAAYCLAVLCKEHAIMAPAVGAAMLLVAHRERPFRRADWRAIGGTFVLYAAAALYVVWQVRAANILGNAYQTDSQAILAEFARRDPSFDPLRAYPLSVLTQAGLFFQYLWLWALPNPGAMSVDMNAAFALHPAPWRVAAACCFALWPLAGLWLLLRRGRAALCGLAMLAPWLMFLTEVSTVRAQEIFVLYRSYLWMPLAVLAVPLLAQRLPARVGAWLAGAFVLALVPAAANRLWTFSDEWLLWNDAARLAKTGAEIQGAERIFRNRGVEALKKGRRQDALDDNTRAIAIAPNDDNAYSNRGMTWLTMGRDDEAMRDFDRAIALNARNKFAYLGRSRVLDKRGEHAAARRDVETACLNGFVPACRLRALDAARRRNAH